MIVGYHAWLRVGFRPGAVVRGCPPREDVANKWGALMVKKSLADTWSLFKENVVPISLVVLPIAIPTMIIEAIIQNLFVTDSSHIPNQLIPTLIAILVEPIYSVAVIFYIASIVAGEKIDAITLWRLGIKFWLPYVILSILFALSVMVGFILLIVPGIILWTRWSFASFDLLLNRSKPYEALRNSWTATKSYVGVLLKGYSTLIVILYGPNLLLTKLMEGSLGKTSISFQVFDSALELVYIVLDVMFTIFAFRIYILYRTQNPVLDEGSLVEEKQTLA